MRKILKKIDLKSILKKKEKKKGSLKKQMTTSIFGLTFIMLIIFISTVAIITRGIIYKKSETELKNYSEQIYSLVKTSVDGTVNNYLNGVMDVTDNRINEYYLEYKSGNLSREEFINKIIDIAKGIKIGSSGYAYVMDDKGNYLWHPNETGKNVSSKSYIQEILKTKNGIVSYTSVNKDAKGSGEKTTVYKTYDVLGIVLGIGAYKSEITKFIDKKDIENKVEEIKLGKTGLGFVVNSEGNLIIHATSKGESLDRVLSESDAKKIMNTNNDWIKYSVKVKGKINKRLAYVKKYEYLNWTIAYTVNQDELLVDVNKLISKLLVISLIMMTLALFTSYWLAIGIVNPIILLSQNIKRFSNGEFNFFFNQNRNDEIGDLSKDLDLYKERLEQVLKSIQGKVDFIVQENTGIVENLSDITTESVNKNGIVHLVKNIEKVLDNVRNQTASSEESLAALEEISATSNNLSEKIKENSSNLNNTLEVTENCNNNIKNANSVMENVGNAVKISEEEINLLNKVSNEINGILTAIRGISDQTNLLALNAAIEAARAGEAGRGFAVVADEIRKLAEKTNSETGKIENLVDTVQVGVSNVKTSMDSVAKKVSEAMEEVNTINAQIDLISSFTRSNVDEIESIVTGVNEQSIATQEVSHAVSIITEGSVEIESNMVESNEFSEEIKRVLSENQEKVSNLNEQLLELKNEMEFFKV